MRFLVPFLMAASALAADSGWFVLTSPAMTAQERKAYRSLGNDREREAFERSFWAGKSITEAQYLERVAYADVNFGSGVQGSGPNTDQGRIYIANGAPASTHRLPSSRVFVACEVWYYDSLPRSGYRARLQLLFYRRNGTGDFRLFSPALDSIRSLLIPQPGTRLMFPVNDVITANDIRDRLKYSPAEEEVVEAAVGVARGITGTGNAEILSRVSSVAHMIRQDRDAKIEVNSRFTVSAPPEVRILQFWVGDIPVTDIQVRSEAVARIGIEVMERSAGIERSEIPLDLPSPRSVLYIQRVFLAPGNYTLVASVDGRRTLLPFTVSEDRSVVLRGEGLEEKPGDLRLSLTPDPRTDDARRILAERLARRNRASVP